MNLNLTDKQRRTIVLSIAGILIVLGLMEPVFKITLDRQIMDNLSFILMAAAAFLLFTGKKNTGREPDKDKDNPQLPSDDKDPNTKNQ